MGSATFKGGIHPYDGKELSMDRPIRTLLPKDEVVFLMSQHIGAPATPTVAVNDKVLVGQIIGAATGFISANVVSSVSGTVKAIEPRQAVNGDKVNAIIVTNDHEYTTVEDFGKKRDYTRLSKEQIRNIIKDAGIVGMGGAGFPTHVKMTPKDDDKIEYVIVNGAECEPYLTSDYRMMMEEPERIVNGLKIILSLFTRAKGVIAIEDNKPEAIEKLSKMVRNNPSIEVCPLKTKYPQGGERSLIYAVTGRKVNSSMLPADVGCVVSNIDTTISIGMAVSESTPLIRRIVTVTGDAIAEPCNYNVRIGMSYREVLEAAGGLTGPVEKIISGGPMMGMALFSLDVPVAKTSSALLCLKEDEATKPESACIRCGRCATVCPGHIIPQKAADAAMHDDLEGFIKYDGLECCECGCCTYVCPAGRNLTQALKQMRKKALASRKK
ncbi:MAG: electron transport complex subunit RsxC [Lachnospiraceae bacterium]|nr:electron transport complex subunit RsxC [Lachnospiraceae bacterium]